MWYNEDFAYICIIEVGGCWSSLQIWRAPDDSFGSLFEFLMKNQFYQSQRLDAHTDDPDTGRIASVAISSDSSFFASGSTEYGSIWVWKRNGTVLCKINNSRTNRRRQYLCCLTISPDNQYILSGGEDKLIKIWDLSGACICKLEGHSWWIQDIAISSDMTFIASASSDNTIRIWRKPVDPNQSYFY